MVIDRILNKTAIYQEFQGLDKYGEAIYLEEKEVKVNESIKKEYIRKGNIQNIKELNIYYSVISIKLQSKINNKVVIDTKDIYDFRGSFVCCMAITSNLEGDM